MYNSDIFLSVLCRKLLFNISCNSCGLSSDVQSNPDCKMFSSTNLWNPGDSIVQLFRVMDPYITSNKLIPANRKLLICTDVNCVSLSPMNHKISPSTAR